jgi:hypothetical protein
VVSFYLEKIQKALMMNRTSLFLIVIISVLLQNGCDNPVTPTQRFPNVPSNLILLTPQTDNIQETYAQLNNSETALFYITKTPTDENHASYWIREQAIGNDNRGGLLGTGYSVPHYYAIRDLKIARAAVYFIFAQWNLYLCNNFNPPGDIIVLVQAFEPRISPDSQWIAYTATYPFSPPNNVYIVTQLGDYIGTKVQITHSENAPPGFEYSYYAVCWLSNNELVIKRKRNRYYGFYELWDYDLLKYDTNNTDAPPILLSTVNDTADQPMGYSEFINQDEGWYIDSFGDVQAGYSNLYKCPLGVAGNYGQQLTFGGDWDTPTYLSNDGKKLLFVRTYRKGTHYLTGASDVYMMDFGSEETNYYAVKKMISQDLAYCK